MRGKVPHVFFDTVYTGITPAYAGKSDFAAVQKRVNQGSPPPMRGKAELNVTPNRLLGDHPRLCGEKRRNTFQPPSSQGSPPPMRGKD